MDDIDWEKQNLLIGGETSATLAICSGIETANTKVYEFNIQKTIDKSLVRWRERSKEQREAARTAKRNSWQKAIAAESAKNTQRKAG